MDITLRVVGQADPSQIEAMRAKIEAMAPSISKVVEAARGLAEAQKKVGAEQVKTNEALSKFDGSRIAKQASDMAKGVAEIGGASKLTAKELQEVRARTDEAVEKFQALGKDVPEDIARLAKELNEVSKAAGGIDEVGAAAERSGGKLSAMAGAAKNASLAIGAGVLAGGVAFAAFGVKAVGMASDVAESQNKVNVVFGESKGAIEALADAADTSLGQTRGQVLEAAGTFGNLLTALGSSKEAAAGMSVDMIKLASDLGSFNNADPTEVLEALRSGLTGEAEPMKRFGVALNEVAMQQAAMKAGLGDNVQALTEAEKMQLRYNIIMEQTKTAQGDFANTSSGMANSMKIIKSGISDAVAEIGAGLLPAVEKATAGFTTFLKSAKFEEVKTKVIDAFAAIGDRLASIDWESVADTAVGVFDKIVAAIEFLADNPVVAKIVGVLGLIASTFGVIMVAIGPFIPIVMSVVGAISGAVTAAGGLSAVLATAGAILTGPVAIAIAVVIAAFLLWRAKGDEIKAALGAAFEAIKTGITAAWEGIKTAFSSAATTISAHSDTIKAVVLTILTGGLILLYAGWVQYGDQIKAKAAEMVASIKQKWEDLKSATLSKWNEIKAAIGAALTAAAAKVSEVLAAIRAFLDAAWTGIAGGAAKAWQDVVDVVTTVFGIIRGLVDTGMTAVRDAVNVGFTAVQGVVQAVWFAIQQAVQTGIYFVQGVVKAGMQLLSGDFAGAWNTIKNTVALGVENVKRTLGNLVSTLQGQAKYVFDAAIGIGRNIGEGIRSGLQGAWDLVLGKLRALVDLLPQTVRDLLGIHSKSTVFEEIATWIGVGLASGIQKSDQKAVEALANVIGKMVSVAGGLADFGKKIAEMVVPTDAQIASAKEKYLRMTLILTDFIKSVSYLGSLLPVANVSKAEPGQVNAINAGLIQLSQMFPAIKELQGLKAENLLTGGEASWAGMLADTVGKIASVWGGIADNMTKMASAVFPSDAQMDALKASTIRIALWAQGILEQPALPALGAEEFARAMKAMSDALSTVAGLALAGAVAIVQTDLDTVAGSLGMVWQRVALITRAWRENMDDAARAAFVAGVTGFASAMQAARDILDAGMVHVDSLKGLVRIGAVHLDIIRANALNIWLMVAGLSAAFRGMKDDLQTGIVDGFKRFGEAMSAAVDLARLANVGELKAEIEVDIGAVEAILIYIRDRLAPALEAIVGAWSLGAEAAKRSTEGMQEFAGWISAAIELAKLTAVGTLKAEIQVNMDNLPIILDWLRTDFVPAVWEIAKQWTVGSDAAKAMTEQMQAFGAWISAAVAVAKTTEIGELRADVQANMDNLPIILEWLRDEFAPMLQAIAAKWGETVESAKEQTERMQAFSGWISAAVGIAKGAEVGEVKAAILVNMTVLSAILVWMRDEFVPTIQGIAAGWGETAESAKPILEKMQAFASVIKAAVDIAKSADVGALAGTLSPANLSAGLGAVKANVLALFKMIGEIAKEITLAEASARADLADALGRGVKAFGDFGSGIAGLMGLAESRLFGSDVSGASGPLSFAQRTRGRRADFFASQLRDTVVRAVGALQQAMAGINITPDDPKTTAIQQLGDAFKALAEGLQALAEAKMPSVAQIAAVVAAASGVGTTGGAGGPAGGSGGRGKSGAGAPDFGLPSSAPAPTGSPAGTGAPAGARTTAAAMPTRWTLNITSPVYLNTEQIGAAIQKTIHQTGMQSTMAPQGV